MQAYGTARHLRGTLCPTGLLRAACTRLTATSTRAASVDIVPLAMEAGNHQTDQGKPASRPKVHVRLPSDGVSLTVSLVVAGKQRNLNRPKDEPLQKALFRLRASVHPAPKDKKNKKRPQDQAASVGSVDESALPISLYKDQAAQQPVSEETSNQEAWSSAALLVVGNESFTIVLNAPYVEKVVLPRRPMAGFPLLPSAVTEFSEPHLTRWTWWRRETGVSAWEAVGQQQLYTPTPGDVGCSLKCEVTPGATQAHAQDDGGGGGGVAGDDVRGGTSMVWGEAMEVVAGPVEPAPSSFSAQLRCPDTQGRPAPAPSFRILSYNLLADQYAASNYAQTVLFNYCPPPSLDPDYRCQLILAELLGYAADVMCLQEVDAKLFHDFLTPHLALHGYSGHFTNKQGKVREGSATFWRTSRFTRLLSADILLRDVFKQPLSSMHSQWQPMLSASPELVKALQKVTTIAQMCLLMPVGSPDATTPPLCVINTHLFYHPYAPHIRTMHTAAVLEEAAALLNHLNQLPTNPNHPQVPQHTATADPRHQDGVRDLGQEPVLLTGGIAEAVAGSAQAEGLGRVAGALRGLQPSVLFCGDLNSDLNDGIPGVVGLLQEGRLTADHWDWVMGANFRWGMNEEEGDPSQQASAPQPPGSAIAAAVAAAKAAAGTAGEPPATTAAAVPAAGPDAAAAAAGTAGAAGPNAAVEPTGPDAAAAGAAAGATGDLQSGCAVSVVGIDVRAPFTLRSADDLATPFTNFTSGYKALLDYVWYQPERLQVTKVQPTPTEQQLGGFIPNTSFPSDHLAVVYDLCPVSSNMGTGGA